MTYSGLYLQVGHNFEMAHRLFLTPGKCQQIHGHSFYATLTLWGNPDPNGLMESVDFGDLKGVFRHYLDSVFDHHVALNKDDPFAQELTLANGSKHYLPGLTPLNVDPTTENLACMIANYMNNQTGLRTRVHVQETAVNAAGVDYFPSDYREPKNFDGLATS